jgi:hypothetical protein
MSFSDFVQRLERTRIGAGISTEELESSIGVQTGWLSSIQSYPHHADIARMAEVLNELPSALAPDRFDTGQDAENAANFARAANNRLTAERGRKVWDAVMGKTCFRGVLSTRTG